MEGGIDVVRARTWRTRRRAARGECAQQRQRQRGLAAPERGAAMIRPVRRVMRRRSRTRRPSSAARRVTIAPIATMAGELDARRRRHRRGTRRASCPARAGRRRRRSQTIGDGVSADRPAAIRAAAIAAEIAPSPCRARAARRPRASAAQSVGHLAFGALAGHQDHGVVGVAASWPGCRQSPAPPRPAVTPGMTRNGMPACSQRQRLLAAAAEHERVAALQAQHALAGPGQLDQPLVMSRCWPRAVRRACRHIPAPRGRRQREHVV